MILHLKIEEIPFPITLPLPLLLLEDLLTSLTTLSRGGKLLFPGLSKKMKTNMALLEYEVGIEELLHFFTDLLQELRLLGPFTLLEVEQGTKTRIQIRLR